MTERDPDQARRDAFAAHKREQARRALAMTMAERLRWLEVTLDEMRALRGLARRGN